MNDILKYVPIHFDYCDRMMSVPMGEIVGVQAQEKGCTIHTRNDSWTTDTTTREEVLTQWKNAFNSLGSGLYL